MSHCEVDSFLTKFKQLWHAGIEATLTVKTVNGGSSIALTAGLGPIPGLPHHVHPSRQHRGAAYYRRQERRQEARRQAERQAVDHESIAEKATEVSDDSANTVHTAAEGVALENDLTFTSGAEIASARSKISSLTTQLKEADQKFNEQIRFRDDTIEDLNNKIREASEENEGLKLSISAKTMFYDLFKDEMKDKFGYDSDEEAERNWQEHLEKEKLEKDKFSCCQCIFISKTEAGLKIHESKKHRGK